MVANLIQCAKLYDWKLTPYLRKTDKLDLIGELALERAFNVQTSTMPLWLCNMQNKKRIVLTMNCFLISFCFNNGANNQVWASCGRFKIRVTPLFQDVQTLLIDWLLICHI